MSRKQALLWLPTMLTVASGLLLLLHGPLAQPAHYNEFADESVLFGIHHASDVLSSIAFALVAIWGWVRLRPERRHPAIRTGWPGYQLFLLGLLLTAAGSAYYHLLPDNERLVWDRIPIGLTCAGLLAAVRAETRRDTNPTRDAAVIGILAVLSVCWWHYTDSPQRPGDLRPFVLLQLQLLLLIPLWQTLYRAPRRDRAWFAIAALLYVLAKLAEFRDHELLAALGLVSGHTLKHFLAAAAAGVLVGRLAARLHEPGQARG